MTDVQRLPRSDAGRPRVLARDMAALSWIADMRAVAETDLGVLLGRLADREPLTVHAAKSVVRRWQQLGLVEARRVLAGGPRVVTLTPLGAEIVGEGRVTAPAWTQLTHTLAVARARLWIEETQPELEEWVSERRWRREHDAQTKAGVHVPDAEVVLRGGRWAVEVEATPKGVERTAAILERLTTYTSYVGVLYLVTSEAVARTVRAAAEEARQRTANAPVRTRPVHVRDLPADLPAAVVEHRRRREEDAAKAGEDGVT